MNRQAHIPDTVLVKSRLEPNTAVRVWWEEGFGRQTTEYIGHVVEKEQVSVLRIFFPFEGVPTSTKSAAQAKVYDVQTIQQIMPRLPIEEAVKAHKRSVSNCCCPMADVAMPLS